MITHFIPGYAKPTIARAAELLEQGMFQEALSVYERLDPSQRDTSAARRVFVRLATGMGRWKDALETAKCLRQGNEADRFEAARAFQALGAEANNRGREEDALRLVRAAISLRLDLLGEILLDERYSRKFRDRLSQSWK